MSLIIKKSYSRSITCVSVIAISLFIAYGIGCSKSGDDEVAKLIASMENTARAYHIGNCARRLGELRDPRAIEPLISVVREKKIRSWLTKLVVSNDECSHAIKGPELEYCYDLRNSRSIAVRALGDIANTHKENERAWEALRDFALTHEDGNVQSFAWEALQSLYKHTDSIPTPTQNVISRLYDMALGDNLRALELLKILWVYKNIDDFVIDRLKHIYSGCNGFSPHALEFLYTQPTKYSFKNYSDNYAIKNQDYISESIQLF